MVGYAGTESVFLVHLSELFVVNTPSYPISLVMLRVGLKVFLLYAFEVLQAQGLSV
jgi:hypothetical protein